MIFKTFAVALLFVIAALGQDACNESYLDPVGFLKLGSYKGTTQCGNAYGKTYYISQHIKSQWINTRSICQSFGMDSLSIETAEEQTFFLNLCDENIKLFEDWTHVGAMTTVGKSTDKWYWASTGKKINYPIKWGANQPDFAGLNEFCMVVMKRPKNFDFNDVICQGAYDLKFICQKNDY